jgi:hypothetical protein
MPAVMPYVAGIIGALLALLLTDWSIIILSALAGAAAILSVFALQPLVEVASFMLLALAGILVQRSMLARRQPV